MGARSFLKTRWRATLFAVNQSNIIIIKRAQAMLRPIRINGMNMCAANNDYLAGCSLDAHVERTRKTELFQGDVQDVCAVRLGYADGRISGTRIHQNDFKVRNGLTG
jgi:hypothetical protein